MPLMTYEEYRKVRHKTPYTYSINSGSNILYYFGERHSFNPDDVQWLEMKSYWQDFLEKSKCHKRIVFVEGGQRPSEDTQEQAIIKHGGMGLVTYLAKQEGVEIYSPEPNEKYERGELVKQFSKEEIQYYYFARIVHQWGNKQEPKPDFTEYMSRYLESDKNTSGWANFDFSVNAMKKIHDKMFQTTFDENNSDFFYSIIDPAEPKTIINKVSAMSSDIRDRYIVGEIRKYILNEYSVFVEYGCTHAVMQEPLLREVL